MSVILLCDDNLPFAESLAAVLTALGHTPYIAPTALAAQLLVEAHRPDAVLLDLVLPANGAPEFLRWLRGRPETASVPVCISSGLPPERTGLFDGEPNVKVVTKPADTRDILRALGLPDPRRESER